MKVEIIHADDNWKSEVNVSIDPQDIWDLDSCLAEIIVPALQRFRKETHSYPAEFADDNEGFKKWEALLDKMIWSFEQAIDGYNQEIDKKRFDMDAQKQYIKEVQEGIDLFAKYYMNLWD